MLARRRSNPRASRLLSIVSLMVFSAATLIGVFRLFDGTTRASGILVIICALIGVFFSQLDRIVRKLFRREIPFSILLLLILFAFLATVPGEIGHFYYSVFWWDMFLHVFAGFGICLIVREVALYKLPIKRDDVGKIGFFPVLVMFAALGGALVWESTEFLIDSVFQTNMQKVIPPEFLPNETGAVTELNATDAELAAYYREPGGYRYALMDTMEDHFCYLVGTLIWLFVTWMYSTKNQAQQKELT